MVVGGARKCSKKEEGLSIFRLLRSFDAGLSTLDARGQKYENDRIKMYLG